MCQSDILHISWNHHSTLTLGETPVPHLFFSHDTRFLFAAQPIVAVAGAVLPQPPVCGRMFPTSLHSGNLGACDAHCPQSCYPFKVESLGYDTIFFRNRNHNGNLHVRAFFPNLATVDETFTLCGTEELGVVEPIVDEADLPHCTLV